MFSRSFKTALTALALGALAVASGCADTIGKSAQDDRGAAQTATGGTAIAGPHTTDGPARCTEAVATAELEPIYVMFVVDGSGTMNDYGKWQAIVPAISAIIDQVAAKNDPTVGLGIIGFADSKDPSDGAQGPGIYGPYPTSVDVPIGYVDAVQAMALKARLDTTPKGITPTQAALEGGYAFLKNFTPQGLLRPGGRKVLVLITDGYPASYLANFTCPPDDGVCTRTQIENSIKMAASAAQGPDPIATFAVGVGAFPGDPTELDYDPVFMGRLAVAGGTRRTPNCNPYETTDVNNVCHFQVTPSAGKSPQQLREEAFQTVNAIRQQPCDFAIKNPPAGFELDTHTASVRQKMPDGTKKTIFPNPTNGWSFDDPVHPKRVLLNGDACASYREAGGGSVEVVLACK